MLPALSAQEADPFSSIGYSAPSGWELERNKPGREPELRFSKDLDAIKIRLRGGKGSRYASASDFVQGFEATTLGRPPEKLRKIRVAGRRVWLYRHGYPVMLGDPHMQDPRPPQLAQEEFCVIPWGGKFWVLSWTLDSPVPDPEAAGERAWELFLSSFVLKEGRPP